MPDHYADDIYSDINRKKQLEDAQENKEFDRDVEAYRKGQKNLTDEERLERMKDITAKRKQLKDNLLSAITVTTNFATDTIEDAKEFKPWYDVPSNIGALGLRAIDSAIPTTLQELQAELVELKSSNAAYPALKLAKEIPIVKKGLGKLDEATINLRKNLLASIRGDRILPDGTILKSEQTERMATGFKENIDKIPKKNRAPDADFTRTKVDEFARVTKHKIRKYVEKYGGSAVDLERIFKEYTTKHHSALNAKAWLNKYWKDLNKGIGQGGLKNARLKIVDGKLQIVDGRTKKTIEHPFELDHSKAKELMHELGLEGADMSDNLNIVYSEWNRAKNNIGNPAIPDAIAEAVGQSTTLENFVRRRLDEAFKLAGERVPQRFKEAAKTQMLDDAQNLKPNEKLADVIEKRLKVYDDLSNFLVQVDDYVPAKVQRSFDKARDLNPQEYLQDLKDRGIYDRLTGPLKKLHDKLSDDWINLERGLRSRPTTKYMKPGHDV